MASKEGVDVAVSTNVLSLCAGGGGLDLGVGLAVPDARTVCYVENEVTACGVLANNMEKGWLDEAPIWTNLRTFDGTTWRGVVDCVIGGYPCQPFSLAGRRLGTADPRHLWPDVRRIVEEIQPRICFFENVGAHLRLGFDDVARDLQGMGYTVAAGLFKASEVGAPHGRERIFIMAHCEDGRCGWKQSYGQNDAELEREIGGSSGKSVMGDTDFTRLEGRRIAIAGCADEWPAWPPSPTDSDAWRRVIASRPDLAPAVEPSVRGVADGLAGRLGRSDQLHILGNGVVPQQAALAFRTLYGAISGGEDNVGLV